MDAGERHYRSVDFAAMLVSLAPSLSQTIGILFTFGGIGLLVNGIIVYIVVLALAERRVNREASDRRPGADATRTPV
ncbi:MAG: hypothetical protein ACR2ML_11465 [Solirubrobacteraceae bacterium]